VAGEGGSKLIACVRVDITVTAGPAVWRHTTSVTAPQDDASVAPAALPTGTVESADTSKDVAEQVAEETGIGLLEGELVAVETAEHMTGGGAGAGAGDVPPPSPPPQAAKRPQTVAANRNERWFFMGSPDGAHNNRRGRGIKGPVDLTRSSAHDRPRGQRYNDH
jgi:hypothetical protein